MEQKGVQRYVPACWIPKSSYIYGVDKFCTTRRRATCDIYVALEAV